MQLEDATEKLETRFGIDPKVLVKKQGVEIASGGEHKEPAEFTVLYLRREDAVASFYSAMLVYCSERPVKIAWVRKPQFLKMQTTIMDARNTHRIAGDRFVVSAEIVCEKE